MTVDELAKEVGRVFVAIRNSSVAKDEAIATIGATVASIGDLLVEKGILTEDEINARSQRMLAEMYKEARPKESTGG